MPWGFAKAFEIDTVESRRQREVTKFGNFENETLNEIKRKQDELRRNEEKRKFQEFRDSTLATIQEVGKFRSALQPQMDTLRQESEARGRARVREVDREVERFRGAVGPRMRDLRAENIESAVRHYLATGSPASLSGLPPDMLAEAQARLEELRQPIPPSRIEQGVAGRGIFEQPTL